MEKHINTLITLSVKIMETVKTDFENVTMFLPENISVTYDMLFDETKQNNFLCDLQELLKITVKSFTSLALKY